MNLLNRLLGYQQFDDWVADYTFVAARTLNQVAGDLIVAVENEIGNAGWREGLFSPASFVNDRIAPLVREVAESAAQSIIEEANLTLQELVDLAAVWVRSPEHAQDEAGMFDGVSDVAAAAVPLAAGVATAAAVPTAAFTTTTAFFGLVTVTAISWPVVVGGSAIAGLGIATGIFNGAKLRDKTATRLRNRARRFIIDSLIDGSAQQPSILQQLAVEFARTAERAKTL